MLDLLIYVWWYIRISYVVGALVWLVPAAIGWCGEREAARKLLLAPLTFIALAIWLAIDQWKALTKEDYP